MEGIPQLSLKSFSSELAGEATGIEVIQDPHTIQRLYNNLVHSAKEEILLFLPTTSAFLREEKIGIIQSIQDAALRGISVKVLTPSDEKIEPKMQSLFQNRESTLELRTIRHKAQVKDSDKARTKILVIDKKEYLVVELKDDSKETFVDAVRLAVYSATAATVKSYLTLFESLWDQAELYEQLEAHDKMQREFINVAAHELRTPIQPLLGLVEILDMNRNATAEEEEQVQGIKRGDVKMIARNVLRLERISQAILDSARIESDTLKLNKEKFDLNEKIMNTISDVRTSIKKDHHLQILFERTKPIVVEADKTRIFEVLSNILRNAVKFTNEGAIQVTLEKSDDSAIVTIRDSGKGIDPEIMPKLFTRFAIGKDSASGSGLGLYISKAIIEAHGGKMGARNNDDGKGAAFSFTLPIAQ
jgi:two-component system, OmpR family, sensor histidine kinase VicK